MPIQLYAVELRWISYLEFTCGRTPKYRFEFSRVFYFELLTPHAGSLET